MFSFIKGEVFFCIRIVSHQMMLLLVMVKHVPILSILISTVLHCVLQTLDELTSIERIKEILNIEVIILRKKMRLNYGSSYHALFKRLL